MVNMYAYDGVRDNVCSGRKMSETLFIPAQNRSGANRTLVRRLLDDLCTL